jgi:hypothetical protein
MRKEEAGKKIFENSTKLTCFEITGLIGSSSVQCYDFYNFKSGVDERFRRRYIL